MHYAAYISVSLCPDSRFPVLRTGGFTAPVYPPEERIADTSLGKPSEKVRHNYEIKGGKSYLVNLYDFYQNGKIIFTARCVDGVVTEVRDSRDHPQEPLTTDPEPPTYAGPSVEGFSNPEDFYDWYMDDFYDYYDAEDYYYDHGGR